MILLFVADIPFESTVTSGEHQKLKPLASHTIVDDHIAIVFHCRCRRRPVTGGRLPPLPNLAYGSLGLLCEAYRRSDNGWL
ncbi:hypothetical protein HanPSC8_Chr04g0148211 [Helianthus annuus]|nr:hypothetical protein HanPSC8_Chr04g0148211 [Helianthus annuus]